MGEYSIFHWLVVLFILALAIPVGKILKRTGHNSAWCLFSFVPFANIIALWVFAFKPWPIDRSAKP